MAELSLEDRQRIWRGLMRHWSNLREVMGALSKSDIQAAPVTNRIGTLKPGIAPAKLSWTHNSRCCIYARVVLKRWLKVSSLIGWLTSPKNTSWPGFVETSSLTMNLSFGLRPLRTDLPSIDGSSLILSAPLDAIFARHTPCSIACSTSFTSTRW